ncbi:ThiF family adenylyltransferase [Sphingobium ummariense]
MILIDFDRIERRNLNRLLNATLSDAQRGAVKVEMMAAAITEYRGDGVAIPVESSIDSRDAVIAAAQGDVLFSCVDTNHARQIADLMATAFVTPLIDMGVTIPVRTTADGFAIADAVGRIDYVQPGRSTLRSRGVWSPASVRAEYVAINAPDQHAQEIAAGYIDGAIEEAPAVISLNMRAAAAAMIEFLARPTHSAWIRTMASHARSSASPLARRTIRRKGTSRSGRPSCLGAAARNRCLAYRLWGSRDDLAPVVEEHRRECAAGPAGGVCRGRQSAEEAA